MMTKINCLNAGYIQLLDHMGDDSSIIKAARQCYGSSGDKLADERLLTSVVKHRHTSCLEHTALTFEVKCPIFVARQWMRHRVGCSYNERSLRYTEAVPEFYVPDNIEVTPDNDLKYQWLNDCMKMYENYKGWLEDAPREQARALLPMGLYTTFTFSCNMASLLHFLELRLAKSAQYEIRVYAEAILELIQEIYPVTTKAIREELCK